MKRLMVPAMACGLTWLFAVPAQAQLNGSHTPGDFGVQSGSQPQPGFYAALFYFRYDADTIKDADGNVVRLSSSAPGSIAVSAVAPLAWYVSKAKVLGANYGAMVVLPFANASIEAPAFALGRTVRYERLRPAVAATRLGLAHRAGGRRRRNSAVRADRPVRARRQRQHRERHVDVRAVRRGRRSTSTRSGPSVSPPRPTGSFMARRKRPTSRSARSSPFRGVRQVVPRRRTDYRRGVLRPVEAHGGSIG